MLQFLKFTILCGLASSCLGARKFPDTFMIGAGTAAFQIEGGWDADGKGPSIWDVYLHESGGANGDIAADSYHKWEEDVEHIKAVGLNFYRFSISWPRILPNGTINHVNQAGVDYYMNLIKALKELGIEPVVTLYHWDMPQSISLLGGFLNVQFVGYFEDYVRLCYELYGQYVKYWLTFNEPYQSCHDGYGYQSAAPGLYSPGDGIYQCSYVLLKAHARAYKVYDEEFRSKYNGQVAMVINGEWREPATNGTLDLEAQERALQFSIGWFANPLFVGNWPQVMIDRIGNRSQQEGLRRSRLPEFTQEEIDYIKGTHDFYAFNTYGTQIVKYQEDLPIGDSEYLFDRSVDTGSEILPDALGMRKLINFINDRYQPKAIMNTENGVTTEDILDDQKRINFLKDHINSVLDAILIDNIKVIGYSVWSIIDNFEWGSYDVKYGLIRVDFDSPNRTRTWKSSARWYQNLTYTRILEE